MSKIKHKYERVRHLSGTDTPGIETQTKIMNLTVKDIHDFPRRIALLDNLHMDILNAKLYSQMPPIDLMSGRFEVAPGYEEQFKEIASEHGFNASEVVEV